MTSVRCNDGRFYQEPVWRGESYFICFDDNDPPEIVIKLKGSKLIKPCTEQANEILAKIGFKNCTLIETSFFASASRMFKNLFIDKYRPCPAFRFFITISEAPPPPNEHRGASENWPKHGVIYHFNKV